MHEFEDVLNESETDADRFAAFLKLKTGTRPRSNPQLLLGSYDISFDIDVDLVKRTEKIPRNEQNLIVESQPQPEIPRLCEDENLQMQHSFSGPPARRNSLTSATPPTALAKGVPSPIRCVDIKFLSQTHNTVDCTFDFQPTLNSTAAPEKQTENQPKEFALQQQIAQKPSTAGSARTTGAVIDLTSNDDFETSCLVSLMHVKCEGNLPLDLPKNTTLQRRSTTNESISCKPTTEAPSNQIVVDQQNSEETPVTTTAPTVSDLNEVLTHDDAHEEELNSNTVNANRQTERSSMQLLDLHSSFSNNLCNNRAKRPLNMVLNKPSRPAINGEEYAQELARMSHHDILDLRKRNSMGLPWDKERHSMISKEEQLAVEQHIQSELLRRQSVDKTEGLTKLRPLSAVIGKPLEPVSTIQFIPSKVSPAIADRRKRTRRPRREAPMTEELKNYLKLPETIETRLRSRSSNMSKRSLYTKGNSDVEDNLSQSPLNKRYWYRGIQILPAPPKNTVCHDGIIIVSPPPASLRYSQAMCKRRRSKRIMSIEQEEVQQQRHPVADAQKDVEQEDVELRVESAVQGVAEQARQEDVEQPTLDDVEQARQDDVEHARQKDAEDAEDTQEDFAPARLEDVELQETEPMPERPHEIEPLADEGSTHMEALRMETPTPPLPATYEQDELNEEPSTSKASRQALERSLNRQQKEGNQKKKQGRGRPKRKIVKNNAIKKPPSCASQPQKTKTFKQIELSRLTINLKDATLPPDENELTQDGDSTVRRSRRGQVPLRNAWCHTLDDPFAFMRAIYNGDRSTLDSSARKRKREQQVLVTDADTQPSQVEHQGAEIRARSNKRVRIRDPDTVEPAPETEPDPNGPVTHPNESPDEHEDATEVGIQTQSSQLLSWLRGISSAKPLTNVHANSEYESMNTSSVAELQFSNLNGIEYAFYCTEDLCTMGYMRLQPLQQRGMTHNKLNHCRFVVLYGEVKVESRLQNSATLNQVDLQTGDMVEIKKGSRFNMSNLLNEIDGHGMMLSPAGRSSRWRYDSTAPKNYDDNGLYCGGLWKQTENGGLCGLCGDDYSLSQPRPNEHGGKYGQGVIVNSYIGVKTIEVNVLITANHLGYFTFDLCNLDEAVTETEECFNKYPLNFVQGNSQLHIGTTHGSINQTLQLPSGLTCKHCVLRWTYTAGNNCCGAQETFKNCADVSILNSVRDIIESSKAEVPVAVPEPDESV
ncbi:hypothetical protein ACLKA7_010340 [Drosophila subpalustris]